MARSDVLVRMQADTRNYDANIAKARKQLDGFKKDNLSLGGVLKQTSASLVSMAASYASVTAAIGAASSAIRYNIETARGFEKSMSQLSSLTGMVGKDLDQLKEYAIELGSKTTLSASQVADAFKLIGSQQPQLLSSGKALKEVTQYAITLSEAAGIDLATAAQTLSTSINQMGGDSNNAQRYVNVLAAASQKGAGDIAWLGEALTKSATAAKAVGTDYEELVANLEQLAKAGFDASTAGTALRSIIMNLEKQANTQFKPSVVGLTQAFENLGKANLDITGYQSLVGKMFATQAMAMANAAGEARSMTEAITGTNTAVEQARTNTDNLDGALKGLSSAWEGLNLHINSSNGMLTSFVVNLTAAIRQVDKLYTSTGSLRQNLSKIIGVLTPFINNPVLKLAAAGFAGQKRPEKDLGGQNGAVLGSVFTSTQTPAANPIVNPTPLKTPKTKPPKEEKIVVGGIQGISGGLVGVNIEMSDTVRSARSLEAELRALQEAMAGATNANAYNRFASRAADVKGRIGAQGSVMAMGIDSETKAEAMSDIIAFGEELRNQIKPIEIKVNPAKNLPKIGEETMDAWNKAAAAISSAGSALQGLEDPGAKVAGIVAQAVANIALGFAQAAASPATGVAGVFGWIAAATAGVATMVATIQSIRQATSGFAEGGVVPGNSYSGDNMLYGLNAGEVVLNRAQTANVAAQLTQAGSGQAARPSYVSGENVFVGTNNYLRRAGKGEIVTTKMLGRMLQ